MSITKQLIDVIANPNAVVDSPRLKIATGQLSVSDPGIQIEGLGEMPFPLKARHVKQIEPFTQQAPYGKGTQTVVDTSVRNTREIKPEAFRVSGEFRQAVAAVLPDVAAKLGVPAEELRAEIYKLLIYEKGGRFDWHRDAEKRKGMIGSLIVVLPCKFGGGELTVRNQASSERNDFRAARLEQAAEYVAFYSDTQHSVARVSHGVRVCLAYNLFLKSKPRTTRKSSIDHRGDPVTVAVHDWMDQNPDEPMVIALEHQYTAAGLKPRLLKGVDREVADSIMNAAADLDCRIHLGMVSRHLCQYADDGYFGNSRYSRYGGSRSESVNYDDLNIGEVYEDEIVVDGWKDFTGASVAIGKLGCGASDLISLTPFEKWKPTEQDYEGYTGNAGNTLDRWYHKSAIVLWSNEKHFDILTRSGISPAVDEFLRMRESLSTIEKEDELENACDDLDRFARAIIAHWPRRFDDRFFADKTEPKYLKAFADELIRMEDPDLVGEWLVAVAQRDWVLPLSTWVPNAIKTLGKGEVIPPLTRLLETKLPPNKHGQAIASGLPKRDAAWLLKLCEKSKSLRVSIDECAELVQIAIGRFASDVRDGGRNFRIQATSRQATWLDLVKASLTIEHQSKKTFEGTGELFALLGQCEPSFDLRSFQVNGCVELIRWSEKKLDQIAKPVKHWHETIRRRLLEATERKPQPPTDQARSANVSCNCEYCSRLSVFLINPSQSTETIRARQDRRDHVENIIRQDELDIKTTTLRSGTPHGLVMTKTQASHGRAFKQYQDDLELIAKL